MRLIGHHVATGYSYNLLTIDHQCDVTSLGYYLSSRVAVLQLFAEVWTSIPLDYGLPALCFYSCKSCAELVNRATISVSASTNLRTSSPTSLLICRFVVHSIISGVFVFGGADLSDNKFLSHHTKLTQAYVDCDTRAPTLMALTKLVSPSS